MFQGLSQRLKKHHEQFYPFSLLVLAQICVLIIPAFEEFIGRGFLLDLTYTAVIFMSIYIVTFSPFDLRVGVLLSSFSILSLWVSFADDSDLTTFIHLISLILFFSFCAFKLWVFLYKQNEFNTNTILGAIAGYMYIGFICAMVLSFIELTIPDSFKDNHIWGEFDMIYLSFVTITTLGYGDVVPIHPVSRSFCILFAICGQTYLTVIVAIIVGQFLKDRRSIAEKQVQFKHPFHHPLYIEHL